MDIDISQIQYVNMRSLRIAVVYVQVLCCGIYVFNPLSGNAPYFVSLLCLTPDNFTRQVYSACRHSMG